MVSAGKVKWRPADGNASEGQWQLILEDLLKNPCVNLRENDSAGLHVLILVHSQQKSYWETTHSLLSLFMPFQRAGHTFLLMFPPFAPQTIFKTNTITHCPFTTVQYSIFFLAPSVPCSHPLCTTGWSTCAPHSLPATPTVSHFCPLTVWQLRFTKLTSSAV